MTRVPDFASDKLRGIQILRGLAAMCVVIYHVQLLAAKNGVDSVILVNPIFSHMYYGVDIFFVISGFIMTKTVIKSDMSAAKFLRNRLLRIVPLYWVLSIILFIGINVLSSRSSIEGFLLRDLFWSMSFLSGTIQNQVPIIDQGWSLEYEMIFYLLISFFLIISKGMNAIFLVICALLVFVTLGMSQIVLEFGYGIAIYIIVSRFHLSKLLLRLSIFIGTSMLILVSLSGIGNDFRIVFFGFPAALIVLGGTSANVKDMRKLVLLGEISYSLYLSQSLVLWWLVQFAVQIPLAIAQVAFLLCVAPFVCILIGYAVYNFFERPLSVILKSPPNSIFRPH